MEFVVYVSRNLAFFPALYPFNYISDPFSPLSLPSIPSSFYPLPSRYPQGGHGVFMLFLGHLAQLCFYQGIYCLKNAVAQRPTSMVIGCLLG